MTEKIETQATEQPVLWLVEVVWENQTHRSWHAGRSEATAALIELASELAAYNADTADDGEGQSDQTSGRVLFAVIVHRMLLEVT